VKRSEPNRALANVNDMVEESVELAGIELRRRNVQPDPPRRRPPAAGDGDRILIEQVLINLMKNAAESIDLSDRPPKAQRRTARASDHEEQAAWSSPCRQGKGLPPEVLERLFEAFFSTKRKAWAWA
jgi:C4-dicarboxylate-specific signal transduction histidine kinase